MLIHAQTERLEVGVPEISCVLSALKTCRNDVQISILWVVDDAEIGDCGADWLIPS